MKDCCRPDDEKPGRVKRILNSITVIVLGILALAALASLLFR